MAILPSFSSLHYILIAANQPQKFKSVLAWFVITIGHHIICLAIISFALQGFLITEPSRHDCFITCLCASIPVRELQEVQKVK
jgi:hypothetical protein